MQYITVIDIAYNFISSECNSILMILFNRHFFEELKNLKGFELTSDHTTGYHDVIAFLFRSQYTAVQHPSPTIQHHR